MPKEESSQIPLGLDEVPELEQGFVPTENKQPQPNVEELYPPDDPGVDQGHAPRRRKGKAN